MVLLKDYRGTKNHNTRNDVPSVLPMHERSVTSLARFLTCFMLSLKHESGTANLLPCTALPPWQSWQPCLPLGWSVCRARCCWWWRGLHTWGCRALCSSSVLQTAATHLDRPMKCQAKRVNNTKSVRHAHSCIWRSFLCLKASDDEQGWDVELGDGLCHAVHEFAWKCPNTECETWKRKHFKCKQAGRFLCCFEY